MVAVHQRAVGGAKVGNTPGVRIFATNFSVGTAYVQIFNSDVAGKGAPHYDLRLSDGEGTVCGEVDKAGLLIGGALRNSFGGIELIKANAEKFGVSNLTIIEAKAPEGMADLPPLDAVIIGGSAGGMGAILDETERLLKPGGRLVVTAVTVETGYTILKELKGRPFTYEGYQLQVNRFRKAGPYHLLNPLSPIFIVTAVKTATTEEV